MRLEKAPNCGSFLCNTANKRTFYGDNTRKGILYFEFSNVLTFNELAKKYLYGIFIQDAFE